jgi:hypothetical protein
MHEQQQEQEQQQQEQQQGEGGKTWAITTTRTKGSWVIWD